MNARRRDLTEPVTVIGVAVAALVAVVAVVHGLGTEGVATAAKGPATISKPATPIPPVQTSTPGSTTTPVPPGVQLATAVYDLRANTFLEQSQANTPFAAESLTKLLIAMDLVSSGQLAGQNLPRVQNMLATSDDEAANQLWTGDGGPLIIARSVRRMDLTHTVGPKDPGRWGDTVTTATDVVRIYQYLMTKTPAAPRDILLTDLSSTSPRATDGTDQNFGIISVVPMGQWWVKQAWACCRPAWDVHTTGLVGPDQRYVVVAMSQQPTAGGFGGAASFLTTVTKKLVGNLNLTTRA